MVKIAIESTGSDYGFGVILEGAKEALKQNPDLNLILVAGKDRLQRNYSLNGIELELTDFTYNSENNKDKQLKSSIYRSMELNRDGEVDAVISPGDTRGGVTSAHRILGYLPNVLGPAIPTHFPINNVLIDSGANPESSVENLYQSAIMGKIYAEKYVGVNNPLIGLITNGREKNKGSRNIKKARRLVDRLRDKGYNVSEDYFEGDFFKNLNEGKVGVTDGHTGNILLKGVEAATKIVKETLKQEVENQIFFLKWLSYPGLYKPSKEINKNLSYKKYSTAPLLGIDGNVMICHGKSNSAAITNAILITKRYLRCNVNESLKEEIGKYGKP